MDWNEIYKILSHETRRKIITLLGESKVATFTELSKIEPKPGKLYYHLNLLKDLITQDERGTYRLTAEGYQVYKLLKSGIPPFTDEGVKNISTGEDSRLFLPRFFLFLSTDSSLILSSIIILVYIYLSIKTFIAIVPFYIIVSPFSYIITASSFILSIAVIVIYLKLVNAFSPDRLIRLTFALLLSYIPMLLPFALVVFNLYTNKILFYLVTFFSQITGLVIFTSGTLTVTNQSLSRSVILPLTIHYINSLINYLLLV